MNTTTISPPLRMAIRHAFPVEADRDSIYLCLR